MRLFVYVLEGRDWAVKDSYVKLQVGKFKYKTRVLRNTKNPVWNEEFAFRVHDLEDELLLSVYHHDNDSGIFNASGELVGQVRIPVWSVAAEELQNLPPTWFTIEKPNSVKSSSRDCADAGKILLTLSMHRRDHEISSDHPLYAHPNIRIGNAEEWEGISILSQNNSNSKAPSHHKILEGKHLMKSIAGRLEKLFNKYEDSATIDDSSEMSTSLSDYEDCIEEPLTSCSFDESMEMLQSVNNEREMPENLQGGVLVDQTYFVPPKDFNKFLFAPNSKFRRDLSDLQGATDVRERPWTWKSGDMSCLTRVVTYTNPASKLVKAVKATEEQTYIKADGREFSLSVSVSTPDAPDGSAFKIELLYKILPGPILSPGEETSHLIISWGINFYQNTMMRGMIEGGARQGLKESFDQFAGLLSQNFKTPNSEAILDKDQMLENLQTEHQSDWELATEYFCNFTVIATIFMILYVFVHILLSGPSKLEGLEFYGLELPDSFGELITGGILILQLERVYDMVSHFIQARLRRGSDHGVKAQGDGWVLTVALIEATNLASLDSAGFADPYVVLTCNGKTRASSVKLQTLDPQWNDILEFDAAEEPPSVVDVEVLDFDGPFDQAASLGNTEINFLKHTSTELADMWVPLEGKLAQSSQSKLHLRIFLDNNNGVETIKEYLHKMEKEVGNKLNLRSPHRNSTFQKLFALPPEEFLINDFSCSLRRKMPLQGRLFLSSRIIGFYANLFGHKTKFFFLWEDIEDIQVFPPSWASVGSPLLVMVLRKGRGFDARHGAKSQDEEGRLCFYFHSFVSFNAASRTIMALWRTRTLSVDQKAGIAEEQQEQDGKSILPDDIGSSLIAEDAKMSKVYSAEIPVNITSLMEIFDGGNLEHTVMGKSGCLNYVTTSWELVNPNVFERRLCYKFNRGISIFGGEVSCTQQKSPISNERGWMVKERMVLHDVPFGSYFRINCLFLTLQYKIIIIMAFDPNPNSFPILSYVMSKLPTIAPKRPTAHSFEFDIEQQPPPSPSSSTSNEPYFELKEQMPHLTDPKLIAQMRSAVDDVAQTRSILKTLGPRPDHESVDIAKAKLAEIDSKLMDELDEIELSPPDSAADRDEDSRKKKAAEVEKQMYKAVISLDEMHQSYGKLLKEAEETLEKIYESAVADCVGDAAVVEEVPEEFNEEVVRILQDASVNGVERIDLSGRQLRFLPEEFGKIRTLVALNLSSNQFEMIPDSIAGLENLEELNISTNLLESLPESIGLLLNMKILDVSGNKLTALPDSICHCRSLVELDASFNELTYLPTNIGYELLNLRRLSIQLNKICSLPTSICEMSSLRILDVHFNELRGLPLAIGRLTNLELLNLSSNFSDLTELPETFGDLTNLKELDLSNNQIHALPITFGRLENLINLKLEENPIVFPPKEVVNEGVEAVKAFMAKRWLNLLLEEEEKSKFQVNEQTQVGWLTRSTSWLKDSVSVVSESFSGYIGVKGKTNEDPYLNQQL